MNRLRGFSARVFVAVATASGLVACRDVGDLPSAPGAPDLAAEAVSAAATTGPVPGEQMFSVSLDIEGEPRVGGVVTVNVSAEALVPSKLAELSVLAPEIRASTTRVLESRRSGQGPGRWYRRRRATSLARRRSEEGAPVGAADVRLIHLGCGLLVGRSRCWE